MHILCYEILSNNPVTWTSLRASSTDCEDPIVSEDAQAA